MPNLLGHTVGPDQVPHRIEAEPLHRNVGQVGVLGSGLWISRVKGTMSAVMVAVRRRSAMEPQDDLREEEVLLDLGEVFLHLGNADRGPSSRGISCWGST